MLKKGKVNKSIIWMVTLMMLTLNLVVVIPPVSVSAATQATYYVSPTGSDTSGNGSINSPWATMVKARDAIRSINSNMTGDIIVYFRGGTYTQSSTIVFETSDSGTNGYNIKYQAYPGETPVFSGGINLTGGWTLHDSSKNIYKKTGVNWSFRQLYVGGKWGIRSRVPNLIDENTGGEYYSFSDASYPYDINSSYIGSWANNGACEFVYIGHWTQHRGRISGYAVNGSVATVSFKAPESSYTDILSHPYIPQTPAYFYFENAYELIDSEGEWFLDTTASTLYYKPRSGENMSTIEVIAPKVDKLISIDGTMSTAVHNIQFYGLSFMYSNWVAPSTYGYFDLQGGHFYETANNTYNPVTGMIDIKYANNIRVERSKFKNGGSWGIMEHLGCDHNSYIGNVFTKLASGAIAVGNTINSCASNTLPIGSQYDTIKNNLIDSVAYYYRDSAAISTLKSKYITIENNEVRNVPHTAITQGFEWEDTGLQDTHDNIIRYNRIHNAMLLLDDGGGIYSLGKMTNTSYDHNYIYNLVKSPYQGGFSIAGMYLDNGSCYKTLQYNVTDLVPKCTYANNQPNHDNMGQYNYYNSSVVGEIAGYSTWANNTSSYGTAWPLNALDVMNSAGIESAYRDIGDVTLGENISLKGTVSSSSSYNSDTVPSKANDNNCESGLWASNGIEANPWWQVDLGRACRIYEIDILARQDMDNPASRTNFAIRLSNDSSFATYTEVDSVSSSSAFLHKGIYSKVVNNTGSFRYVRVQRINGTGHFNFAECRIFGTGGSLKNYASGGIATGDSQYSDHAPSRAIDSNWADGAHKWSSEADGTHWLQVDLGASVSVSKFIIEHEGVLGSSSSYNTKDFIIQGSNNGSTWTNLVTVTGNTQNETVHDTAPVSYRYFRLYITNPGADTYARIVEFMIYGS